MDIDVEEVAIRARRLEDSGHRRSFGSSSLTKSSLRSVTHDDLSFSPEQSPRHRTKDSHRTQDSVITENDQCQPHVERSRLENRVATGWAPVGQSSSIASAQLLTQIRQELHDVRSGVNNLKTSFIVDLGVAC